MLVIDMRADTVAEFEALLPWIDVTVGVIIVSLTAFIWVFFQTGNKCLALAVPCLYAVGLVFDFLSGSDMTYEKIIGQNCADPEFLIQAKYAPWVDAVMRFEGPIARQNRLSLQRFDRALLRLDGPVSSDRQLRCVLSPLISTSPAGIFAERWANMAAREPNESNTPRGSPEVRHSRIG